MQVEDSFDHENKVTETKKKLAVEIIKRIWRSQFHPSDDKDQSEDTENEFPNSYRNGSAIWLFLQYIQSEKCS